jgi:hypothetical protein
VEGKEFHVGDPSKPPEVSEGTSEHTWVLGGRYVEQRFDGTFMGMPFSGIGYTGYDKYKKRYVGVWMDAAGTACSTRLARSTQEARSSRWPEEWTTSLLAKSLRFVKKMTFLNKDEILFEMWAPDPHGKDYLMMKIDYTRKM